MESHAHRACPPSLSRAPLPLRRTTLLLHSCGMPLAALRRFRFAWGLIDLLNDSESPAYAQNATQMGISTGVFARRCVVKWSRDFYSMDSVQTHFDVVNVTAGDIDETWIDADFATCESAFDAFWGTIKTGVSPHYTLQEYRWYRLGPGATPPETAVRVTPRNVPATGGGDSLPPQLCVVVSLRTALRKRWGRMYLPAPVEANAADPGLVATSYVDSVAGAANAFETALSAADFEWVVYSKQMSRAYAIERLVVDNSFDTQRSRGFHRGPYQKVYGT